MILLFLKIVLWLFIVIHNMNGKGKSGIKKSIKCLYQKNTFNINVIQSEEINYFHAIVGNQ